MAKVLPASIDASQISVAIVPRRRERILATFCTEGPIADVGKAMGISSRRVVSPSRRLLHLGRILVGRLPTLTALP